MMKSVDIQTAVYDWVKAAGFNAPYGVLTGQNTNRNGRKFLSVTFGRARTLDATVEIYNSGFMLLRTSRDGSTVYKSFETLMDRLRTL